MAVNKYWHACHYHRLQWGHRFGRVTQLNPDIPTALEGVDIPETAVLEDLRPTGAGVLVQSGAIEDDGNTGRNLP